MQTAEKSQRNNTRLSSTISLLQLISKINSEYGNFYKYIPKSLLSESQQKSKQVAEADEEYRLKVMRGEDVSQILKDNAYNDVTKVRTYIARKDVGKLITDDTVLYLNENKKHRPRGRWCNKAF